MDFKKICFNCMKEKPSIGGYCPNCGFKNEDYLKANNELPPLTPLNGKYLLGRALGAGGFGITYIALDTHLQVVVAIKELFLKKISVRDQGMTISVAPKDKNCFDENKKRFLKEARVLAMFNEKDNEGVVSVKDYFEEKNTAYIVMEYLDGETLKDRVKKQALGYEEMLKLLAPVAHALTKIHQFKVVHLDVSPDNIMILNNGRAKLLDFGGAKTIGIKDSSGQFAYKKGYAPLEQRSENSRVNEWTDVFSLASTMYYCLTGVKPTDAWDRQTGVELKVISAYGVKIPASAEAAIMRALELKPTDRYQTIDEFWNALVLKNNKNNKSKIVPIAAIIAILIIVVAMAMGNKEDSKVSTEIEETNDSPGSSSEKTDEIVKEIGQAVPMNLGTYIFENAKDRNYIMGVDSGFGDDGTSVILKNYEDTNKNRFSVTDEIEDDGFYNLRAAHTNSFIETTTQDIGETVRQYSEMYDMGTEKWYFVYCGHDDEKDMDEVIIKNAADSVLAPKDGNIANGTEIVLAEYNIDDDSQKWFVRWSEKDETEKTVTVYHEGDLVEDMYGVYNISSALDGMTSMCISRDEKYHPEPTAVVFHAEWLTTNDQAFQFELVPVGEESRYKIFPIDQLKGEHKCLEYNPDTNELVMREESDNENQLFRVVYVKSNTYLLQTYNESVVGFDLGDNGTAEGTAVLSRSYDAVEDSRLETWLLTIPHED